jgi:DNA-binding NarL/FixJ family response regulator
MDTEERKQIQGLYRIDGRRLARETLEGRPDVIRPASSGERGSEALTAREIAVIQLVADGCANREIGQRLAISEETVKSHIRHLLGTLHARNRAHAVAIAIRRRLVI